MVSLLMCIHSFFVLYMRVHLTIQNYPVKVSPIKDIPLNILSTRKGGPKLYVYINFDTIVVQDFIFKDKRGLKP